MFRMRSKDDCCLFRPSAGTTMQSLHLLHRGLAHRGKSRTFRLRWLLLVEGKFSWGGDLDSGVLFRMSALPNYRALIHKHITKRNRFLQHFFQEIRREFHHNMTFSANLQILLDNDDHLSGSLIRAPTYQTTLVEILQQSLHLQCS